MIIIGAQKKDPGEAKAPDKGEPSSDEVSRTKLTGEDIYKQALRSTVFVVSTSGNTGGAGSGFLVDRQRKYVLTNYHVVCFGQTPADEIKVCFPVFDKGKLVTEFSHYAALLKSGQHFVPAKVVRADQAKDLALIELESLPRHAAPLRLARTSPKPGQTVHSVGNPGGSDGMWLDTSGTVRQVSKKKWVSGGVGGALEHEALVVETQLPVNPGDSGGPMVNEYGELVGVTQGLSIKGRLLSYSIDVTEARDFVQQHFKQIGAEWREAPGNVVVTSASLQDLLKQLEGEDTKKRQETLVALAELGHEARPALERIIDLLKDRDQSVVRGVRVILKELEPFGVEDLPVLRKALKHAAPEVRVFASETFLKLKSGADRAVPDLVQAVLDNEQAVVFNAVLALEERGHLLEEEQARKVLPSLVKLLRAGNPRVRLAAITLVGSAGGAGKPAVAELIRGLEDADAQVRGRSAEALGRLGTDGEEAAFLLLQMLQGDEVENKARAALSLANVGPKAKYAIPHLNAAYQSSDRRLKDAAQQALVKIGPLSPSDAKMFLEGLKDKRESIRMSAARLLGELRADAGWAVPELVRVLDDPAKEVRMNALSAIESIRQVDKEVISGIRKRLAGDGIAEIRVLAADTVRKLGTAHADEVIPALAKALEDDDTRVRASAAKGLAEFGAKSKGVLTELRKGLRDKEAKVQVPCARAIALIGRDAKEAIPDLLAMLKASSDEVWVAGALALGKIGPAAGAAVGPILSKMESAADIPNGLPEALAELGPGAGKELYRASRSDNAVMRIYCIRVLGMLPMTRDENMTFVGHLRLRLMNEERIPEVRAEMQTVLKKALAK